MSNQAKPFVPLDSIDPKDTNLLLKTHFGNHGISLDQFCKKNMKIKGYTFRLKLSNYNNSRMTKENNTDLIQALTKLRTETDTVISALQATL